LTKLDAWLRSILWDKQLPSAIASPPSVSTDQGFEVHRLKARLQLTNGEVKIVQGVREIFDILDARIGGSEEIVKNSEGKIVIIGRRLLGVDFGASFIETIESPQ